ncbi:Putative elongator complex protein 1 [Malassezia cuniculi]|uniref:Elongator complex protein 1 n=1 Tax=Malassezia cuniculi TaxID=948313 RepID=A0AAF0EWC0_9BASI|nr:Putative elongator complex protein 1 [Malassezia cuniculi]
MRNLVTLAVRKSAPCVALAVDAESGVKYGIRIHVNGGLATLAAVRLDTDAVVASLAVAAAAQGVPQVVAFRVLADAGAQFDNAPALGIVTGGGDIVVIPLDGQADIVGSVERGICAASWSPDEDVLALVAAAEDDVPETLIMMSRDFDILSEAPVATDDFGADAPVNVGWGSKATQFHGSEGKAAALAAAQPLPADSRGPLVDSDDRLPRLSWRSEGSFLMVSTVETNEHGAHRVIRTFTRTGTLSATSDPSVRGIAHTLAVRPTGNIVATCQKFGGAWAPGPDSRVDVAFFERNGLRHGGFTLSGSDVPAGLFWNADGTVLAVHYAHDDRSVVQLWTTGNYHWYRKQELSLPRVSDICWHAAEPLVLVIAHEQAVEEHTLHSSAAVSSAMPPYDTACAAVADGSSILLTPFRLQNVPPPMSALSLSTEGRVPRHMAWASVAGAATDVLAVLFDNEVQCWAFEYGDLNVRGAARAPLKPRLVTTIPAQNAFQVALSASDDAMHVALLEHGRATLVTWQNGTHVMGKSVELTGLARVVGSASGVYAHDESGTLARLDGDSSLKLGAFCPQCEIHDDVAVGLSGARLFVGEEQVAPDATSFTVTDRLVIWTATTHESKFIERGSNAIESTPLSRRVERGSRIVAAIPTAMALVLQMPRGNLETIYPRPMVLAVVRTALDQQNFGEALRICRVHRLDMNLLYDHNPESFMRSIDLFIDQVSSADHINLLLTGLRRDTAEPVNSICDAFISALERKDRRGYLHSILTAHVRKQPADLEGGVRVLGGWRTEQAVAEDACRYLIFLADADQLFRVALGLYDFELALLVAQQSPRDPREYVAFLRSLRAKTPEAYQKFCIDDHLGRHGKALAWLAAAGEEHAADALQYVEQHKLYREAMTVWKHDPPRLRAAYSRFGDYLASRERSSEAATAYIMAGEPRKALATYTADDWRAAFALATSEKLSAAELARLAREFSGQLEASARYADAAQVLLAYSNDLETAVALLCRANDIVEALRVCGSARSDLVETHVRPAALDAQSALVEEIDDMSEQLEKQVARLGALDERRQEAPAAFLGDDAVPDNIDVSSEVSLATQFTRYTAAPSIAQSMSTLSLSSRAGKKAAKEDKKKRSGRKGSVYEEDYLYESVQRLVGERLRGVQQSAARLLPTLLPLGAPHRAAASELQVRLTKFEDECNAAADKLAAQATAAEQRRAETEQALISHVAALANRYIY